MRTEISIEELTELYAEKLSLIWLAGRNGNNHTIIPEKQYLHKQQAAPDDVDNSRAEADLVYPSGRTLVGYFNLIHPHQVQVLGEAELKFLNTLKGLTQGDTMRQLTGQNPACIILTDGCIAPSLLISLCDELSVPLLGTPLSSLKLAELLQYYLINLFAETTTLYGVFMEILALGVLITGPSGVGKSELALDLISRGHRLVADDAPEFSRIAPDIIRGTCPELLRGFLEVRGVGIINVRRLYGESSIKNDKYLRLIIHLEPMDKEKLLQLDRLEGSFELVKILDIDIPRITLPVTPGRNLSILIECAIRNHILRMSGYSASSDFIENHKRLTEENSE